MHILYLHQYFTTRSQVGGTRSYEFARYLQRQGHSVTIVTAAWDRLAKGSKTRRPELEGIDVIELNAGYANSMLGTRMGYARRIYSFIVFALLQQEQDYPCAGQTLCSRLQRR